jgi:hypothetical protein
VQLKDCVAGPETLTTGCCWRVMAQDPDTLRARLDKLAEPLCLNSRRPLDLAQTAADLATQAAQRLQCHT